MNQAQVDDVLDYWFGESRTPDQTYFKRWFSGGDAVDTEIQEQFADIHRTLQDGLPQTWQDSSEGWLAAILVIDQFSRNLFRKQPEAFAWDNLAQTWAKEGWSKGLFRSMPLEQQAFSLMPFMHSESLELHKLGLQHFEEIMADAQSTDTIITGFYSSALEHRDIIASFGRYPHRNAVLGRDSTPEELAYLNTDGKRFGQ
jgi:uncharacterized protein (DUF924 family)